MGILLFNPRPVSAGQTEVKIVEGPVFDPPDITIKAGDSVIWTPMTGGTPHHLVADPKFPFFPETPKPPTKTFNSASPASERTQIFNSPGGPIHYICTIHPNTMIGTITVTP
jgi:plastocyanin